MKGFLTHIRIKVKYINLKKIKHMFLAVIFGKKLPKGKFDIICSDLMNNSETDTVAYQIY